MCVSRRAIILQSATNAGLCMPVLHCIAGIASVCNLYTLHCTLVQGQVSLSSLQYHHCNLMHMDAMIEMICILTWLYIHAYVQGQTLHSYLLATA